MAIDPRDVAALSRPPLDEAAVERVAVALFELSSGGRLVAWSDETKAYWIARAGRVVSGEAEHECGCGECVECDNRHYREHLAEIGANFDQTGRVEVPLNGPVAKELLRTVMKHTQLADPPTYNAPALANDAFLVGYRLALSELEGLREISERAALPELSADTHHAQDYAGRVHGFIRAAGELTPVGAVILAAEGCDQELGRARLSFIVACVNHVRAALKAGGIDA